MNYLQVEKKDGARLIRPEQQPILNPAAVSLPHFTMMASYLSGFVELLLEPRYRHGCNALIPAGTMCLVAAGQGWGRELAAYTGLSR